MSVFTLLNKEDLGGFYSLEIIPVKNIVNCPLILDNVNAIEFTYQRGDELRSDILPLHETITLGYKSKKTRAGIEYRVSGGYEVAWPNKSLDDLLSALMPQKCVVKANYHNGDSMLFGSLKSPLDVLYDFDDAKRVEDAHKFVVKISGNTRQKPVFV